MPQEYLFNQYPSRSMSSRALSPSGSAEGEVLKKPVRKGNFEKETTYTTSTYSLDIIA